MSARFPAFAITFSVVYAILYVAAVENNWALFTYHPATGTFGWLTTRAAAGPSMFWYGWLLTAALGAAVVAAIASYMPQGLLRYLWPGLSWLVPICVSVSFVYFLRAFFLR